MLDKVFNIGDVTLHKMGEEMRISRIYQPDSLVDVIQSRLHEHHKEEQKPANDMHIYLDGVHQNHVVVPYKKGFYYAPDHDDKEYRDRIREQPGTIDLSS